MYHSVIKEGNDGYGEASRLYVPSRDETERNRTSEFDRSLSQLLNVPFEPQNVEEPPRRKAYNPFNDNVDMVVLDETGYTIHTENDARTDAEHLLGELETVSH